MGLYFWVKTVFFQVVQLFLCFLEKYNRFKADVV